MDWIIGLNILKRNGFFIVSPIFESSQQEPTNFYLFQKRHQKTLDTLFWSLKKCHPLWRWSVGVVTPVVNWAPVMWKIVAVHRTKWATGSGQFFGPTGMGWGNGPLFCKNFLWNVGMYQIYLFFLWKNLLSNLSKDLSFQVLVRTTKNRCMSKKNIEG